MQTFNNQTVPSSNQSITMFYDADCIICSSEARALQAYNPSAIELIPVCEGVNRLAQSGISQKEAMTYLCVQDGAGKWHTHMQAVRLLYKTAGIPGARFLYIPIIRQLGDFFYPIIARNRYRIPKWVSKFIYGEIVVTDCKEGSCQLPPSQR